MSIGKGKNTKGSSLDIRQEAKVLQRLQSLQLLTQHYPTWREARAELNELPLAAVELKK
jgi:hypothetical protein